jgi:hypothetical protein
LRAAFDHWLATLDVEFFVTLSFAQNTELGSARKLLRHWFARIDYHYLGRAWCRKSADQRIMAIVFPENIYTNLHYHCLVRLPERARHEAYDQTARVLQQHWRRTEPRGSCDVATIYDRPGAARYAAKQLVRPGYSDHYVLASEFHR